MHLRDIFPDYNHKLFNGFGDNPYFKTQKQMTKEDVLGKTPIIADKAGDNLYVNRKDALNAMDEWAGYLIRQKESITTTYDIPKYILDEYAKRKVIDFNKWQTEQGYVNGLDDTWIKALNGSPVASSTEELYNQFTQQIENK